MLSNLMSRRQMLRAVRHAALAGFVIHTLGALWVWHNWGAFGASNLLLWMDFPLSLAYLGAGGKTLLTLSLGIGGLEWAAVCALIAYFVGRSTHRAATEVGSEGPTR
jgi:hypothetical protein